MRRAVVGGMQETLDSTPQLPNTSCDPQPTASVVWVSETTEMLIVRTQQVEAENERIAEQIKRIRNEIATVREQHNTQLKMVEDEVATLKQINFSLAQENQVLLTNISRLYKTSVEEVRQRNEMIDMLKGDNTWERYMHVSEYMWEFQSYH